MEDPMPEFQGNAEAPPARAEPAWVDGDVLKNVDPTPDLRPAWAGRVTNREFGEWLTYQHKLRTNCATLPLTLATWLTFLFVLYLHGHVNTTYRMRQCLSQAVLEVEAPREIDGALNAAVSQEVSQSQSLRFGELTNTVEMWSWIIGGLIPAFSGTPQRPGFVRTFNQVIGDVQLRETRRKKGTCKAAEELTTYYRQTCFSGSETSSDPYGAYRTDLAFVAGAGLPEPHTVNKERFLAWLNVQNPSLALARAAELRHSNWVDDGTESVEAHIAVFNAEIKAYAHILVKFVFQNGGLIKQELEVRPLSANHYPHWSYYIPDILWVLLLIKFIANSAQRVVDSRQRRCCQRCCESPWLALDWISIFLGLCLALFYGFFMMFLDLLAEDLGKLGSAPDPIIGPGNQTIVNMAYQEISLRYHGVTAEIIEELQMLIAVKVFYRLGMYWYCMTLLMRFFQGFRGQPRIMQITSTITSAFADLTHFGLILVVVFVNFALAGYVLFGPEIPEWSRVNKALQTTLAVPFGRLDYETMHNIAPFTALTWLFSFIVTIVFILLNMLLAIITDHYTGVWKQMGSRGHDIIEQLMDMSGDACWMGAYICRVMYRVIRERMPPPIRRCLPKRKGEQERKSIPFDYILGECAANPDGLTTLDFLVGPYIDREWPEEGTFGCDHKTAERLLVKCEAHVRRHVDEFYPLDRLFNEFDMSMKQYHEQLDVFTEEVRAWFSERIVDAGNMEPRQKKLEGLAQYIMLANDPSLEPPQPEDTIHEAAKALVASVERPALSDAAAGD
mmetsp:Transcript_58253/g.109755  ORF Transcript_58253/g.109755 Transcript_58253/m.109755 type:complete len:786 (-) Transcript_58253:116-2473(-)